MEIQEIIDRAHQNSRNKGFWEGQQNKAEKIALMHSELSEALEAIRKPDKLDEHLPELDPEGLEFADVVIRIADYCGAFGIDLNECVEQKMTYNESRPYKHGKKF